MPEKRVRPLNRPARTSAKAASTPSTVAAVAEIRPTRRVTQVASSIWASWARAEYQRVENPPQTVTSRLALNE
jgi:hypothetical protein